MDIFLASLLCLSILPIFTKATIICGNFVCHGINPYCCQLDSGDEGCCWETYVYQMWWFWFIWVMVFFLIVGCVAAFLRRRRRTIRYVVMANSEYPSYGTVVHEYGQNRAGVVPVAGAVPVSPPSYAAAEASKPPPYAN